MAIEEQVRRVLREMGSDDASAEAFLIEPRGASAALRPSLGPETAFTPTLRSCADRMADSGFLVALVRDGGGVYVQVS
jgi:hypothetical protein